MADGVLPDSPLATGQVRTVWLDWEDEQRDHPGSYASIAGPGMVTVLDAVQRAVIDAAAADVRAAGRAAQAFGPYRQGAAQMPGYAARFAEVIALSQQAGSVFTSQDVVALLKSAASAGLVVAGHPVGIAGLSPDQLAASAQAAGHLSEAATRAVFGKKRGEITPEEYDLVTDPARELTRRVAVAIRDLAATVPLVILLDTGEVIGSGAWAWLRRVMTQTGPRVIWVLGARFETEAEAGFDSPVAKFVREIGDEHLILMSPTRFDDTMIGKYLESRTRLAWTASQVDMIARFTRGLPLAISLTATLLEQGQLVEDVCRETDDGYPSSVVSQLARRYLVHAEQQAYPADDPRQGDVDKILALALAYADLRADPDLLATLWDVKDPLAALQDLQRRHDFVLPLSRRLHDDVRDTLRADLLDPFRRTRVRAINQRAIGLFTDRLTQMRARWPALDDQIGHAGFTTALLTVLWHTLWTSNQDGIDLFTAILPVLTVADRPTANAVAAMAEQFAGTFDQDQRRHLDLLTESRPMAEVFRPTLRRPVRQLNLTLNGLALKTPGLAAPAPQAGEPADRHAAVMILRARLYAADRHDSEAITALRIAVLDTTSTLLRKAIGSQAQDIADRLIYAGPRNTTIRTDSGLAAAKIATEARPDSGEAWNSYAVALRNIGRREDALAAHDQAITLDPAASYHNSRGITLRALGRYEDGLAAHDQAITLDPAYAYAHNNRGNTLRELGRHEDALAAYDQAITLNPADADAYNNRGNTLRELGRHEDALAVHDQAITLDPANAYAHNSRAITLRELGRHEDALAAHDQAITLGPADAIPHNSRGITLRALGRYEDGLAAHDQAITLDPAAAIPHNNRAIILRELGRYEDALAAHDQAIAFDPAAADAHNSRGNTLRQLGRREDALAAYGQAITLGSVSARENKGILLAGLGELNDALSELDSAGRLAPRGAGEGMTWAGAVLWHQRDSVGARERFVQVKDRVIGCTPFRRAEMEAIALCGLGEPDVAEQHLMNALPRRTRGDLAEPRELYDLLSDPPLHGIDRLRAIVYGDS